MELRSEDPRPATPLEPVELPELDNGPHFFYGLQWWFFGALAVFGFCYLLYDEWRNGPARGAADPQAAAQVQGPTAGGGGPRPDRTRASGEGSERAQHPAVDRAASRPVTNDAAGDSRKAAARPNSSGSP